MIIMGSFKAGVFLKYYRGKHPGKKDSGRTVFIKIPCLYLEDFMHCGHHHFDICTVFLRKLVDTRDMDYTIEAAVCFYHCHLMNWSIDV